MLTVSQLSKYHLRAQSIASKVISAGAGNASVIAYRLHTAFAHVNSCNSSLRGLLTVEGNSYHCNERMFEFVFQLNSKLMPQKILYILHSV